MAYFWLRIILFTLATVHDQIGKANGIDIGVNYGLLGDNLPPSIDVINLYKKCGIDKLRLFDPNPQALNALKGTRIGVVLGIVNNDLPGLAASQEATNQWFATNIQPYFKEINFTYIAVGNELIPGTLSQYILPVMQNLQNVLHQNRLCSIQVTTVLSADSLAASFPPSAGAFKPEATEVMTGILTFLSQQRTPLMINVYPYFAYASDPVNVRLDYAQFTATAPVVTDGSLIYTNLFDATVDAFFSAMEKVGGANVSVVVAETGWPSAGNGAFTTPVLAQTYNQNLVKHVLSNAGTPKRPNTTIEGFIFAIFNENQKPAGVEQNWGLFNPNMQPVYPLFNCTA